MNATEFYLLMGQFYFLIACLHVYYALVHH
jgi:hypothetical protein